MDAMLVSIPMTVKMLGCGRTTIYELIKNGEIETVKLGKRRLVVTDSLRSYVTNLRSQAA